MLLTCLLFFCPRNLAKKYTKESLTQNVTLVYLQGHIDGSFFSTFDPLGQRPHWPILQHDPKYMKQARHTRNHDLRNMLMQSKQLKGLNHGTTKC